MVDARNIKPAGEYVDISLVAIFSRIRRRWIMLVSTVLAFTALSAVYAFVVTPVYQSSILLAPADPSSGMVGGMAARLLQGFGGAALGGAVGSTRQSRAVALTALDSPYFTRAFIEENNLLPILFADDWNSEQEKWAVDDVDAIPTLSEGSELFSAEVLEIDDTNIGGLVTLYVNWTDPVLAAKWANAIVERVNTRLRQQAIEDADLTIDYLNQELAKTNAVELQQSLYFLIESEIQKKTVAKVQKEYAWRVLSPAIAADVDKYNSPNRPLIVSLGLVFGLLFGLLLALVTSPIMTAVNEARSEDVG